MEDSVALARVIQGELPFTLNLPAGMYPIRTDGAEYPIDVLGLPHEKWSRSYGRFWL